MRTRIALATALGATTIFTTSMLPTAGADGQPSSAVVDAAASMPSELVDSTSPQPAMAVPRFADAVLTRAAGLLSAPPPQPHPATASAGAPPTQPADTVTPGERAAWERVALCEEGGNWQASGPRFSGGLGISRSNWIAFGGGAYASEASQASQDQQIMVAERIQAEPPDQAGCRGW